MISIVIPFNNEKYLNKCLENISKINYSDFEVILVDDSFKCEEEIFEVIKKYKKVNIKYIKVDTDTVGVGYARNIGIKNATGDYICFVDVDDKIEKDLFSNLQKYIDEGIELIKYKMKIVYENNSILVDGPVFEKTDGESGFCKLCFKDKFLDSPCLYIIKKEIFERENLWFKENTYHEDFGLIPLIIVNSKSIVSVNIYGYKYFQTENSIMRNFDSKKQIKKVEDKFLHFKNMLDNLDRFNLKKSTKENILNYYINSIICAVGDLNYIDRKKFEKRIKYEKIIKRIKTRNITELIKKMILKFSMEIYFKIKDLRSK